MEVFISWSGPRSEKVAEALRDWLPSVIQSVEPFMSASDIEKGSRWSKDISMHLEKAQFGLICLTPDNSRSPLVAIRSWRAIEVRREFTCGALSLPGLANRVTGTTSPNFRQQLQTKAQLWNIIKSINEASEGNKLEPTRLERAFETWWPELEKALRRYPRNYRRNPSISIR